MSLQSGFYIIGRLEGFVSRTSVYDGKERIKNTLGISIETINKYGKINTESQDLNVSKDVINAAFHSTVRELDGKMVQVRVSVKNWTLDNGMSGITYSFDENSSIVEVEEE